MICDFFLEGFDCVGIVKSVCCLNFIGYDGIIDLEVRYVEFLYVVMVVVECFVGVVVWVRGYDEDIVLFVSFDCDVESGDVGFLEEV